MPSGMTRSPGSKYSLNPMTLQLRVSAWRARVMNVERKIAAAFAPYLPDPVVVRRSHRADYQIDSALRSSDPRACAQEAVRKADLTIGRAEVSGPGFINITLLAEV